MGAFPFRNVSVLIWAGVNIVPRTRPFRRRAAQRGGSLGRNFNAFQNRTWLLFRTTRSEIYDRPLNESLSILQIAQAWSS